MRENAGCCLVLQVENLVQQSLAKFGRIDFLINNGETGSNHTVNMMLESEAAL